MRGRTRSFPADEGPVDWASGCAWLLRAEAVRAVGPLDERFFMYFDDVDYCRRLWSAGWDVIATRRAQVDHDTGHGSRATSTLAAEGGPSAAYYFDKHLSPNEAAQARRWLLLGWRVRAIANGIGARLGQRDAGVRAARYRRALTLARSDS